MALISDVSYVGPHDESFPPHRHRTDRKTRDLRYILHQLRLGHVRASNDPVSSSVIELSQGGQGDSAWIRASGGRDTQRYGSSILSPWYLSRKRASQLFAPATSLSSACSRRAFFSPDGPRSTVSPPPSRPLNLSLLLSTAAVPSVENPRRPPSSSSANRTFDLALTHLPGLRSARPAGAT